MLPAGANAQYYVGDFLGSSRVMTTNTGTVCYDADFPPYGQERAYTNNCTQNAYKFEGKERDSETQNDDFGARYYTWRFGRWLSADWSAVPVAVPYANLTNPQTLNLYAMVADDPESFADLDGHAPNCGGYEDATCSRTKEEEKRAQGSVITMAKNVTTKTFVDRKFIPDTTGMGGTFVNTYVTVVVRTDENNRGAFVSASTQTITLEVDFVTHKTREISKTDSKDLNFMQTLQMIGPENMSKAFDAAQPSSVSFLAKASWQMVKAHPVKVIGGSIMILGGTLALPINKSVGVRTIGGVMVIIGGAATGLYCGVGNGPGC
jgi:RHS repeat-associated protein